MDEWAWRPGKIRYVCVFFAHRSYLAPRTRKIQQSVCVVLETPSTVDFKGVLSVTSFETVTVHKDGVDEDKTRLVHLPDNSVDLRLALA